jgi:hypothetical protein
MFSCIIPISSSAEYKTVSLESIVLYVPTSTISGLNKSAGQIYVEAKYVNGERENVTSYASVSSSNPSIAYISYDGNLYSGNLEGQATFTANFGGQTSHATVTVTSSPTSQNGLPDIVTGLYATPISSNQINLSWNSTINAQSYSVFRNGSFISTVNNTNYSDYGLTPGTNYNYYVCANNNYGQGPSSSTVNATTSWSNSQTVTGIYLNNTYLNLRTGENSYLSATVLPENAINKTVIWTSSNPNVASVNNGFVTALSQGSATITALSVDQSKTATCYVTVSGQTSQTKTLSSISISNKNINIVGFKKSGGSIRVTAMYSDGTKKSVSKDLTITSSNNDVAYIKGTTIYTGSSIGTAMITVSYTENGVIKTDYCTVSVSTPVLSSISISPNSIKIPEINKEYKSIKVSAKYNGISTKDVTSSAIFTSSNPNVAYILNKKIYSGSMTGTTIITATYSEGGVVMTSSCEVNVFIPTLSELKVSPSSVKIKELNKNFGSINVNAKYSDNISKNVTKSVVYSSSNTKCCSLCYAALHIICRNCCSSRYIPTA